MLPLFVPIKFSIWKTKPKVIIEGPKGCGKTILCATLYQMLADKENFDHVFLTYRSFKFDNPECRKYFNDFFTRHKDLFKEELRILRGPMDFAHAMEMLSVVSKLKPLYVFIDLSLFTATESYDLNQFKEMVVLLSGKENPQILISASSGVQHVTNGDRQVMEKLENVLKRC